MAVRTDKAGRHRIEFQQGGKRILRRCPPGTTRAQATQYEAQLRRRLFDELALGQKPVITLAAAIQLWLEQTLHDKKDQRMPVQNAKHLRPFVAGKTVEEAPKAAAEAISYWSSVAATAAKSVKEPGSRTGLSSATINRRLAVLKAATRHAWRQGWANQDVSGKIRKLREPEGRKVFLTPLQIVTLRRCAPNEKAGAAFTILAYSGARVGELLAMTSTDVQKNSLVVAHSKTGHSREIPIITLLRPYLWALPLDISYRTLWDWFDKARKKANMPHVHIHDLRHTTASLLANAGVDLQVIGKILGHKAVQTTQRYAHLTDKTVRRAMKRLG